MYEFTHLCILCMGNVAFQIFLTLAFLKEKAARVAPIGAF
jgi:hypothetical protein